MRSLTGGRDGRGGQLSQGMNGMRSERAALIAGEGAGAGTRVRLVRGIANLLAVFRFGAVTLVVALTVVLQNRERLEPAPVVVATVATVFSVVILGLGTRLASLGRLAYGLMAVDMAIATAGILIGGGMDSPFLLYTLLPGLTSAMLLRRGFALALAVVPAVTVALSHTVLTWYFARFVWVLEGNYLTLVPVYVAVTLAVAVLPFYANLSLRQTEQEMARRAEQRRLRAELHDNLAQSLSALTMGLRQMRRANPGPAQVSDLVEVSERSYGELRELLDLLEAGSWVPSTVDTLEHLVETWSAESGIPVSAALPAGVLPVPPEAAIALLGIVREALNNVGKHSRARHVSVVLRHRADGIELTIWDDGVGFPPDRPAGHGRRIMQERAEGIGATLEVKSAVGSGTEVRIWYPGKRA